MSKVVVTMVNGGHFEYDDQRKVEYRMTNPDGTVYLKLEGIREVHLVDTKSNLIRNTVHDAYAVEIKFPEIFVERLEMLRSRLKQDYPWFDVYIEPCVIENAVEKWDSELTYDYDYNTQWFFIYFVGCNLQNYESDDNQKVAHHVNNLIGSLSIQMLEGYLCNPTYKNTYDDDKSIILDLSSLIIDHHMHCITQTSKDFCKMASKTITKYGINMNLIS